MANINLAELCQAIAEALGPEWSSITPTNQNWCNDLIHTNGMVLWCRKSRDRLEITTGAVESITEEHRIIFRYNSDNPSLTVSATRAPKAIARDIRNRLLPKATAWWQKGMIDKQVAEEQYAQAQQLQTRLLTFPGAATFKPTYTGEDVKVKGPSESWIASLNHHILTFRSLTSEQMIALLEAYHQLKGTP